MSPNGYRSNFTSHCQIKRPKAIRRWVFVLCRAAGWALPLEFLVKLEVNP